MTKRINAKKKISRKLGASLWGQAKDPFAKRNYRPGQHGASPKGRSSDYGMQLRAKQRIKFYYGNISEKQFFNLLERVKQPDIVIHLKTPVSNLQKNISRRGRPYEQGIQENYLKIMIKRSLSVLWNFLSL